MATNTTKNAAAISWEPTDQWQGDDGKWNTFHLSVGTPPQGFHVTPAISQYEVWVPDELSCRLQFPTHAGQCGALRGADPFNGTGSPGFNRNLSSTWGSIGLWTINVQETMMGYGTNANYGNDTVTLGTPGPGLTLRNQTVGSIPNIHYWMGQFGLQPKSTNFSNYVDPHPSYMSGLVDAGLLPSESFGYTAGAYYRNQARASLTLGGYDTNRMQGDQLSMTMYNDDGRPFMVGMKSIQVTPTGVSKDKKPKNFLPTAIYGFIDSTFPWIWLPQDSVDTFVDEFGLEYNESAELYTLNSTMHDRLLQMNPTFTFALSLSTTDQTAKTINITLPYAAFDLNISFPLVAEDTFYFPIKLGANETQFAIGRAFLQEAYIVADFPRQNFTVAQASFANLGQKNIVTVDRPPDAQPPLYQAPRGNNNGSQWSGAVIAGTVVGIVGGVALITLLLILFLLWWRKKKRADDVRAYLATREAEAPKELGSDDNEIHEAGSSSMEGTEKSRCELDTPITSPAEMTGLSSRYEMASPIVAYGPIAEADVPENGHFAAELPGDTPKEKAWQ